MTEEERKQRRRETQKRWRDANPDYHRQYCEKNKEKVRTVKKQYVEARKEQNDEYMKKYRLENKDRLKELQKKHYHTNKHRYYESNARRRARTVVQDELTEFAFEEGLALCKEREKTTGIEWHVDHIVPLNHKFACGLHVACNFQVVPAFWNLSKRNRHMNSFFPT